MAQRGLVERRRAQDVRAGAVLDPDLSAFRGQLRELRLSSARSVSTTPSAVSYFPAAGEGSAPPGSGLVRSTRRALRRFWIASRYV